jgi:hypothetical protein
MIPDVPDRGRNNAGDSRRRKRGARAGTISVHALGRFPRRSVKVEPLVAGLVDDRNGTRPLRDQVAALDASGQQYPRPSRVTSPAWVRSWESWASTELCARLSPSSRWCGPSGWSSHTVCRPAGRSNRCRSGRPSHCHSRYAASMWSHNWTGPPCRTVCLPSAWEIWCTRCHSVNSARFPLGSRRPGSDLLPCRRAGR